MDMTEKDEELNLKAFLPSRNGEEEAVNSLVNAYCSAMTRCLAFTRQRDIFLAPDLATPAERQHVFGSDCRLCHVARAQFAAYPHPEPLTLVLYETGKLVDEHEAVEQHLGRCKSCQALVKEEWMTQIGRVVASGVEGAAKVRAWLAQKARLSLNLTEQYAYAAEEGAHRRYYSLRQESGDFIVHLEQTELGELRVIVLTEKEAYANQHVLVTIIGREFTLRQEIALTERGDFPAAGSVVIGNFSELARKLDPAELFVTDVPPGI